jgi:DNA-binding NarL/FixJ family response regulator
MKVSSRTFEPTLPSRITILIADDHPVVRLGLRTVFEAAPDLEVVGETGDGLEVVALVKELRPRVLTLDLMMPGLNGIEIGRQLSRGPRHTRVLILSVYTDEAYAAEALRNGAAGYVLKGTHATEVLEAVRTVAAGGRYLSPPLSEKGIDAYIQRTRAVPPEPYETLTTREREVLHLLAEGHPNAAIAARLFVSVRTVETHRANLMRKLGLRTQTDLIRYAIRRGIVAREE